MRTIWKYDIEIIDEQIIEMPTSAIILSVQTQHGKGVMWALVDHNEPMAKRKFTVYGTGAPIYHSNLKYLGTFQMQNGALMWHLFEIL